MAWDFRSDALFLFLWGLVFGVVLTVILSHVEIRFHATRKEPPAQAADR